MVVVEFTLRLKTGLFVLFFLVVHHHEQLVLFFFVLFCFFFFVLYYISDYLSKKKLRQAFLVASVTFLKIYLFSD